MEIDDILASVDPDNDDGLEQQQKVRDLQALTNAWVAERAAPELLPYPTALMDRVMGRVQRQVGSLYRYIFLWSWRIVNPRWL